MIPDDAAVEKAFAEAPLVVSDYIEDGKLAEAVVAIARAHPLHVDVIGLLAERSRNMLLGLESPTDVLDALISAGVDQPSAQGILKDLNEEVFVPLHNQVLSGVTKNADEDDEESETPAASPPPSVSVAPPPPPIPVATSAAAPPAPPVAPPLVAAPGPVPARVAPPPRAAPPPAIVTPPTPRVVSTSPSDNSVPQRAPVRAIPVMPSLPAEPLTYVPHPSPPVQAPPPAPPPLSAMKVQPTPPAPAPLPSPMPPPAPHPLPQPPVAMPAPSAPSMSMGEHPGIRTMASDIRAVRDHKIPPPIEHMPMPPVPPPPPLVPAPSPMTSPLMSPASVVAAPPLPASFDHPSTMPRISRPPENLPGAPTMAPYPNDPYREPPQ